MTLMRWAFAVALLAVAVPASAGGSYSYKCGDDVFFVVEWPSRYEFLMRDQKTGNDNKVRLEDKGVQFNRKSMTLTRDGKTCAQLRYEH